MKHGGQHPTGAKEESMVGNVTIMAIDDSAESQAHVEKILTQAGYTPCLVDSCERALAAVAEKVPDLILVAVNMIDDEGLKACRSFKAGEKTKNVPIIVISEFSEQKEWTTNLQVGAADYITKPFPAKELLTRINTHLTLVRAKTQLEERTASLQRSMEKLQAEAAERRSLDEELRKNLEHGERSRRAMLSILEDQKRGEAALRESERMFRLITENARDMFWLMDLDMSVTWISPAVVRIHGYTMAELTETQMVYHVTPASRTRVQELLDRALTPERLADPDDMISIDVEMEINNKDGTATWENSIFTLLRGKDGRPTGFLGVGRESTDRKLAERALESSESRYRHLFEAAKDGILILDASSGKIIDVNPFLINLTGYSKEEFMDKRLWEIGAFQDIEASKESFDQLLTEGYVRYEDLPLKSRNGGKIDVEFISNTYLVDGHDVIQCNIRDISERNRAQKQERLVHKTLEMLNRTGVDENTIRDLLRLIRESLDIEAAGIRLKDGEDFPYYETDGFSEQFINSERFLCAHDETGSILRDAQGLPVLECMCGVVLRSQTDPKLPFFSSGGSFWSDNTSGLRASTGDTCQQHQLRHGCNREEYESVALVPLRSGGEITGLLQLNDRRKGRFSAELVAFLEGLGASIGIAFLRKQAAAELQFQNMILSTQQETSIDGILVVKDNRVISYNRQFIDLFDIPREAIDPKSDERFWQSVLAQVPNVEEFLTRVGEIDARAHETSRDEMVLKNGNVIDRYSAPLLDAERNNFGRVWYFRDITAAKQAEQVRIDLEAQLRGAQKLEAIGSLAGGVAHDFNNLLSVILSYTGFALKALSEGDPTRDDLLEVKKAAERAAALTRQLLAFSRKQVLQPLPLDLNQIAAGIEKMLRRILGEDIDLVQALAPDLGLVMADPGQIEQVLMNLVVNARDAMPEGGKLTIETCNIDLDDAYAAHHEAVEPGPYVMLAISDSGQGMDEGTKARIFEPFFTTKPRGKGTGLGLSTVYGIVKQSGGDIWVYSELGQGTTFKIYLPRDASARTAAVKEAAIAPANSIKSGTILVVEDEEALRKVTKRTLDDAGYTVLSAANGEEALKASARHAGEIRLLLTDVVMPRMGGRLLAQELLKTRPETEVIYMSGYTDNAIVHHGVLDVGTNFLGKPFTAEALLEKVNAVLGGEASQPAEARGLTAKVPEEREEPALDREALRSLPPGTLARLRTAVVAARYDEITGLLAAIRGANPELAAELQRMADLFDLQGMRDILD